jgi:MinD-like ATPase involved in chromosome partitioning or flagellar assembly
VPLDRRGRPPAEPPEPPRRRRIGRDVEVEYVEHGLDWLAEHVEPADPQPVPEPEPGAERPPLEHADAEMEPEPDTEPPLPDADAEPPPQEVAAAEPGAQVVGRPDPGASAADLTAPEAGDREEAAWFSPAVRALREGRDDDEPDEPVPPSVQAESARSAAAEPVPAPASPAAAAAPVASRSADPRPAWVETGVHPGPAGPPGERGQPAAAEGPDDSRLPGWDDLTSERLLARQPGGPTDGWQGFIYRLTGGRVRPRPGQAERARLELERRVTAPIHGYRRIAVLALKGGVGKTTTTACLGATFATRRADRVVAVDASPDAGTLGGRVRRDGAPAATDVLAGAPPLDRYADVRAYAAQTSSGLEVVASEMDPSMSHPFSDADYRKVASVLERFYSLILTDCGPGVLHTVMLAVLERADQLVVVSAPSVDGARSASLTLDWLEQHGFQAQARSAVVVVNSVRPRGPVNVAQLEEHFKRRCRAVVRIPFDRHLETGAEIELGELAPETRQAYVGLAAAVADGFGSPVRADGD